MDLELALIDEGVVIRLDFLGLVFVQHDAGDDQHLHVFQAGLVRNVAHDPPTIDAGELQIEEEQIGCGGLQLRDGLFSADGFGELVAFLAERELEDVTETLLVVDDQHLLLARGGGGADATQDVAGIQCRSDVQWRAHAVGGVVGKENGWYVLGFRLGLQLLEDGPKFRRRFVGVEQDHQRVEFDRERHGLFAVARGTDIVLMRAETGREDARDVGTFTNDEDDALAVSCGVRRGRGGGGRAGCAGAGYLRLPRSYAEWRW